MQRQNTLIVIALLVAAGSHAQTGSMKATFTPTLGGKPVTLELSVPFLKFDNPHGYWFINPHTGDRHVQYQPERGWGDKNISAGFVTLNEKADDVDIYDGGGNDSDQVTIKSNSFVISAREYNRWAGDKNKPMHIHISRFSASEFSFTISGGARGSETKDDASWADGTVEGSGHFYREPKYVQSEVMPGCDCDPTIYATVYDEENDIRTSSACETALSNKVFDAVQKAMAPLFSEVGRNVSGTPAAGDIDITMLPGHVNINLPAKDRPWCSTDYRHNWITRLDAQKTYFNSEDAFGLRFIKLPSKEELNPSGIDPAVTGRRMQAGMDSIMKLVAAHKITEAQFSKAVSDLSGGAGQPDYKKMEVEHNLTIELLINPQNREAMLLKIADKNHTAVQHTIRGSNFEIVSQQVKESDGSWIANRFFIYLGKFDAPVRGKSGGGYDAEIVKPVYPPNGNKLSIYNIIIKLEGANDMAGKAIAHIDFDALLSLISKQ